MITIQHLTYNQIDKQKWDACINNANNGLIYACSFYLDTLAKNWDALILNDYEAVMPLTWNKKFTKYYLFQPPFCANLGVFGNNVTTETITAFLEAVPKKYEYWDIYLNKSNYFISKIYSYYERINYTLSLNAPYETLYNNFRENVKRNIKKNIQLNCQVKKDILIDAVIELAKEQASSFSKLTDADFDAIKLIYIYLKENGKSTTYGVFLSNRLVASAAFFFFKNRAYYIIVGNHPDGKTIGASHALINAFIKDHSNQNLILDFEGSDIQSLAFFYSSFGAGIEKYPAIKYNNLPRLIRWLKR